MGLLESSGFKIQKGEIEIIERTAGKYRKPDPEEN